jgi:hypothetical protein
MLVPDGDLFPLVPDDEKLIQEFGAEVFSGVLLVVSAVCSRFVRMT